MPLLASDVLTAAGRLLMDVGADRWTYPELVQWLNEAVSATIMAKPSACSETGLLVLGAGTYQEIGSGYLSLLRVTRNLKPSAWQTPDLAASNMAQSRFNFLTPHGFETGDPLQFKSSGTFPNGIKAGVIYYAIYSSDNVIKVAASPNDSATGTILPLSGTWTGTLECRAFSAGRAIRITSRVSLDAQIPDWHDPAVIPYKQEARQYVYDDQEPRSFYVYPGNDGTGAIEVIRSFLPAKIVASGDENELDSYDQDIGLDGTFMTPLVEYVMYRAQSKDAPDANPAGAMAHYQAFAAAVGLKVEVSRTVNPSAQAGVSPA